MSRSYERAVASWESHLRSGGTTTWSAWRARGEETDPGPSAPSPDAPHLELVRRLNTHPDAADGLRDLVLRTPSPGRGLVDAPLAWPDAPRRFGTAPVEPELLPEEELIRLAVGVLARLLPGLPPVQVAQHPRRWPLPWRRRFRLHGSPGTAAGVRALLLDQGVVESDWRPTHVVVARPLEVMMAEHWSAAARAGGILKWSTLWRRAVAADRLPAVLDVPRVAEQLEGRPREPVHVVVAHDAQGVAALVTHLLGVRERELASPGDLAETDLLRRLNRLLALTEGVDRVLGLTARLVDGVLSDLPTSGQETAGDPPVVPVHARAWAATTAAGMAEHLRQAGYPVHGDPAALAPAGVPPPTGRLDGQHPGTVDRARTLELALAACLGAWHQQEGQS